MKRLTENYLLRYITIFGCIYSVLADLRCSERLFQDREIVISPRTTSETLVSMLNVNHSTIRYCLVGKRKSFLTKIDNVTVPCGQMLAFLWIFNVVCRKRAIGPRQQMQSPQPPVVPAWRLLSYFNSSVTKALSRLGKKCGRLQHQTIEQYEKKVVLLGAILLWFGFPSQFVLSEGPG